MDQDKKCGNPSLGEVVGVDDGGGGGDAGAGVCAEGCEGGGGYFCGGVGAGRWGRRRTSSGCGCAIVTACFFFVRAVLYEYVVG